MWSRLSGRRGLVAGRDDVGGDVSRLVEQPVVDEVACAPLGLKSDGKPDGLIELAVSTTQVSPPLAIIGWRPRALSPFYFRLERSSPSGWWRRVGIYVLGITRRPSSALINQADGSVLIPPQPRTLWAHFCRDGHDTPDSRYTLHVGERSVVVETR